MRSRPSLLGRRNFFGEGMAGRACLFLPGDRPASRRKRADSQTGLIGRRVAREGRRRSRLVKRSTVGALAPRACAASSRESASFRFWVVDRTELFMTAPSLPRIASAELGADVSARAPNWRTSCSTGCSPAVAGQNLALRHPLLVLHLTFHSPALATTGCLRPSDPERLTSQHFWDQMDQPACAAGSIWARRCTTS